MDKLVDEGEYRGCDK